METVFRQDNGMPGCFQPVEQRAQPRHGVAVQVRGRLIHDDDLWLHGADGRKGDKLLFPAGQMEYPAVEQPADVHLRAYCLYPLPHDRARQWDVLHPQCDLVGRIGGKRLAARVLKYAAHHRT